MRKICNARAVAAVFIICLVALPFEYKEAHMLWHSLQLVGVYALNRARHKKTEKKRREKFGSCRFYKKAKDNPEGLSSF